MLSLIVNNPSMLCCGLITRHKVALGFVTTEAEMYVGTLCIQRGFIFHLKDNVRLQHDIVIGIILCSTDTLKYKHSNAVTVVDLGFHVEQTPRIRSIT